MKLIKILIVLTNVGQYANSDLKTGLWLSELTHLYHAAEEKGYQVTLARPKGGKVPIDPESLKKFALDKISKTYYEDADFMQKLNTTKSLKDVQKVMVRCTISRMI